MTQVWAPRHVSSTTGLFISLIAMAASQQRVGAGLVRTDLVAGRAVRGERPGDRGRAPVAVVAVLPALPLVDPARAARAGTRSTGVAEAEDREHHLGARHRAPVLLDLVREHRLGVVEDRPPHGLALRRRRRRRFGSRLGRGLRCRSRRRLGSASAPRRSRPGRSGSRSGRASVAPSVSDVGAAVGLRSVASMRRRRPPIGASGWRRPWAASRDRAADRGAAQRVPRRAPSDRPHRACSSRWRRWRAGDRQA